MSSRQAGGALALALATLALSLASPAQAAPPSNDNPEGAILLGDGAHGSASNHEASLYTGEPYSPSGTGTCDDQQMGRSVWYSVVGTGGTIDVEAEGAKDNAQPL